MFLDLLQRGLRTAYRALGVQEVRHATQAGEVHTFLFEPDHRRGAASDRTLVLLHGLGDASTTWYHVVRRLRGSCRIVALDLPPYGLSSLNERPFLMPAEQAREVLGVVRKHADGPTTVVGQSMGGWVTQWLLYQAPGAADQAVLIAPAGARLAGSLRAADLLRPTDVAGVLDLWDHLWYERPTAARLVARSSLARFQRPEYREFLAAVGEPDVLTEEQLATIETPALVVWGHHDRLLDPGTPSFLARHWGVPLPRSYLARCGHLPHVERPDAVLRLIGHALDPGPARG